jgi:DNA replicative helicase MCM subunit Mcm2 (Cdc46/Mcm family)
MRERIHVLLLGDGGALKQSLLSYVASLAPCTSTYSSIGSNANKMGLTLTVQQIHSDTHWYLEGTKCQ